MAFTLVYWAWCLLFIGSYALPQSQYVRRDENPAPAANACGNLIRQATAEINPYGVVNASDVFNCWTTVPFNSDIATRFLKYWKDALQFQSTLDYLKNPPEGYQKPAVDLMAGLEQIQNNVNAGKYTGQYQFESDFQRLLYSANDNHVNLVAGLLSSFKFANPYGLTTLSLDGTALPKVYTTYDLYLNQTKTPDATWQPSAIKQINGKDVNEYLSEFAAMNSGGTLEPHADWNTLMDNPVLDVLLFYTNFQGYATFYPGDEFTFTFENGTSISERWLAIYNNPGDTGPLETGGDFYNFFVLGYYPASYQPPNITTTDSNATAPAPAPAPAAPTSLSGSSIAYPEHADIHQANLTITGYVTGYFFQDASLAVLSIPTFVMEDQAIQEFSDAVQQFIDQAKAQGLKKVVIDVQANAGGDVILAYNTFKQFFPSIDPYGASTRRATPLSNTLGHAITGYCSSQTPSDPDYEICARDEWNVVVLKNAATSQNFTSWEEFYGPTFDGVGNFSLTQRLNTDAYTYDYTNLGYDVPPAPLFLKSGASPWAADDIIILSDALCSSACSLFVEFMRFDGGVKTVAIGGRPNDGPMQTPSLSRAARYYSLVELDTDIENVLAIDETAQVPNRNDQDIFILWGGISLRDQVGRKSTVPYQMQYQPADCRIYRTPDTFNNFTNLWHYAADAMWTDQTKCVPGSTGLPSTSSDPQPQPATSPSPSPSTNSTSPDKGPWENWQSTPIGVTYTSNGIITKSTNSTAAKDIPFSAPDGAQPDANFPIRINRASDTRRTTIPNQDQTNRERQTPKTVPQVPPAQNVPATQSPTDQTVQEPVYSTCNARCALFYNPSSERPSQQTEVKKRGVGVSEKVKVKVRKGYF